ncbi:hypothetical protein GH714_010835 [Hevea brasiliensis]|uniref:Triosephosphate isomerase, cytosolic n=1 Tax=Hevea brasiliensis TaxID=3981 RepID=A0A6A6N0C5_HEVBR|nr:hypothetical protein GH714_010835 [Hevea brasiliensis]
MARNMKQVDDIHEWSNALDKLRRSIPEQENLEIFNELKRSYDYLNDPTLQQCFLYCALYQGLVGNGREDGNRSQDVIEFLIDVGVLEGESWREEFNEGHTMLNKLLNLCLLEGDTYAVKMHNLLKNMAIQIMNADARVIVKMMKSYPKCQSGETGQKILSEFHCQLHGLKMLDLSLTAIQKLPTSISDLVNLSALLLGGCKALRHVPSLAALRALKKLDLCDSGVEKVPKGIKLLSNLRYLDLCGTNIEELQPGILPKLSQLRFLRLGFSFTVEGKEVASLRKLEELECRFHGVGGRQCNGDIPLTVPLSLPEGTFSLLKVFEIWNCPSMKKLFPQSLMSDLQNLEVISCGMLVILDILWVVLVHSERRIILNESNEFVGDKVAYALSQGLKVISCVDETLEQRESGSTMEVVAAQTKAIAEQVKDWKDVVLAYELLWAIGIGNVATPAQAQEPFQY